MICEIVYRGSTKGDLHVLFELPYLYSWLDVANHTEGKQCTTLSRRFSSGKASLKLRPIISVRYISLLP